LVEKNIRPRDIVTEKSVANGVTMDMALGCSTNTVLHLPAIFREAELDLTLDIFDNISRKTPTCVVFPRPGLTISRICTRRAAFRPS
jgi:dihydroxy-acid dehydratase